MKTNPKICDRIPHDKFTYQMADHFPVWIQIKTDIEGFRLNQTVREEKEWEKRQQSSDRVAS